MARARFTAAEIGRRMRATPAAAVGAGVAVVGAALAFGGAEAGAIAAAVAVLAAIPIAVSVGHGLAPARDGHAIGRDELTGLPNEGAFTKELERRLAARPDETTVLAVLELHGLERYAERYGAPAADALVRRLACRLHTAADDPSHVYAPGPGRFALLARVGRVGAEVPVSAAVAALSHDAEGLRVDASAGTVRLPADAETADRALDLAEHRLTAAERAAMARPLVEV
jgi:GGDEF domain-containing protein